MGARLHHLNFAVALMLLTSGCASAGGSSDQLRSTVYATHRMVQDLNQNLSGTVTQLSSTTAELVARLGASNQEMRELMSIAQENQYKLEQLQYSLDTLTATLYRHLNLSPPEPALPAPSRPIGRTPEISRGEIVVEPPLGRPQPDTPGTDVRPGFRPGSPPSVTQTIDEDAHYREAQQLYGNGDYIDALRQFEKHISLFPNSIHTVMAAYWRAHCRFKMGEYAEAISGFEEFRDQYPNSDKVPTAMYNQAVAYSRLGQNARAIELFQRLVREHPDDAATEGARGALRQLTSLN